MSIMKIKNKFVLLIIMSLFLLISIGSVCASDNITDQAIQTYDENSEVSSIESEIADDNSILSTDNDNTLLKADSTQAKLTAAQSVDVNSSKVVKVKLNLNDTININDLKPTVTYTKDNATVTVKTSDYNFNNGTYSFKLNNADFKTANLGITYKGKSLSNFTLNRIYNAEIQAVTVQNEYRVGYYTFRVVDRDDNNKPIPDIDVSLTTMGNIRAGFSAKTDKNGIASFDADKLYEFDQGSALTMKYLSTGYHNVTMATKDNVKSASKVVRLAVTKGTVKLAVSPYNEPYGSEKNVTVTATKSNGKPLTNEIIQLSMPQTTGKTYYFSTDSNGQCKINVKNLIPGVYDYRVATNNTASIKLNPVSGKITVKKARVEFDVSTKTIYYNSDTTATITVKYQGTDKAAPNAIIKVRAYETTNSYKEYRLQTNENGTISFSTSLSVGTHKIYVTIGESQYEPRYMAYDKTGFVKICKASAKYEAPEATFYYKDGKTFDIRVMNIKNNKPMFETKVTIKVYVPSGGYMSYTGTTDANGYIKLPLTDFAPGSYPVILSNPDGSNYASAQVSSKFTIKNRMATTLTATNVNAAYKENKYIVATLKDSNGKPISGAKIGFANNGVTYITTDANGQAKYSTKNLAEGTYSIPVKFFGNDAYIESNKVTSKVVISKKATQLTAPDVTTTYQKDDYIVATLKDSNGKPISGAKIGFANNGVTYITTDANGQAKYSTKNLDIGTYNFIVRFFGDNTYAASDKLNVKVVVRSS